MKGKKSRIIAGCLTALILLSGCSAGNKPQSGTSSGSGDFNAPGQFPICKTKVTLNIGIPQIPQVQDFKTNKFTKMLEEKMNMDLEFTLFPSNGTDCAQKIAVMVAGGTALPDVMDMVFGDSDLYQYGSQGIFIPLNDYYTKSSYYIKKYMDAGDNKTILPLITSADSKIYTVPQVDEAVGNDLCYRGWINKTWLDKLSLSVPKTTEDFYNVLKAFKTKDPNGNGKADEIPMMGSTNGWNQNPITFLMNAFTYVQPDNHYLTATNGKISVAYNTAEWKAGIEYINKLVTEGLLSPLTFTQQLNQFQTILEDSNNQLVGSMAAGSMSVYQAKSVRKHDMVPLAPLTGPKGVQYTTYATNCLPIPYWQITKYCKNPEAAFKLADYMWSEDATIWSRWGEPDVDWKTPTADQHGLNEASGIKGRILPVLSWGSVQNSHWQNSNPSRGPYSIFDSQVWNGDPYDSQYMTAQAVPLYKGKTPKETVRKVIYTADEQDQIKDILTSLDTYVGETTVQFITGNKPMSYWDTYVKQLDTIGLTKYLQITQTAYDRMNKKK